MSIFLNTKHYMIRTLLCNYIADMGEYPSCVLSAINELAFKYPDYKIMVKVGIEESRLIRKYKKHLFSNVSFLRNNYIFRGYLYTRRLREEKTLLVLWDYKYVEAYLESSCGNSTLYRDYNPFTIWQPPYLTIVLDPMNILNELQYPLFWNKFGEGTVAGNRMEKYEV